MVRQKPIVAIKSPCVAPKLNSAGHSNINMPDNDGDALMTAAQRAVTLPEILMCVLSHFPAGG